MARRKPKAPENTLAGWADIIQEQGKRLRGGEKTAPERDQSVLEVSVADPRELMTIEPDHSLWKKPRSNIHGLVQGAIVRLRPPVEADDAKVQATRAWFLDHGAETVTVLPRPRAEVVPSAVAEKRDDRAVSARQAVIDVASESNSKDKAALLELLERVMGKAGL